MTQLSPATISRSETAARAIFFYIAFVALAFLVNVFSPSGPCTMGLGIGMLFLLPFVTFGMLVFSAIKYRKNKNYLPALIIHGFIFSLFAIMIGILAIMGRV